MKDVTFHADGPVRVDSTGHADYPHEPGLLYDCPACEAECFCAEIREGQDLTDCPPEDLPTCVYCAIVDEVNAWSE